MAVRPAVIVVIATVLAVHLVFFTGTYHVSEVKSFVFIAGLAALLVVVAGGTTAPGRLPGVFAGKLPRHILGGVAAFVLLTALSIAWAHYRVAAVFRSAEIALYATWMLLVVLALRTRRDVSLVLGAFLATGVLSAAVAFALWRVYPTHGTQFFLPMGNPNWLAVALLIPMMLCVEGFCRSAFGASRDARKVVLFALAFLLMGATVYKADSQSSAAAFALGLVALPVLAGARLGRKDSGRGKWLLAAGVAAAIALACAADLSLGHPGALGAFARSKSVAIRLDLWRWGATLAGRNPVSGLGAGGYLPNVGDVAAPDVDRRPGYYADIEVHAHNEFLEILIELGVLGLAAFLWPVGAALYGVARLARDDTDGALRARLGAFAAGWLALLLQSFLDVGMRFESVPVTFWTGLAVMAASLRPAPAGETSPTAPLRAPRRRIATVAVLATFAAGFLIVSGMRGSLALKQALDAPDAATRIALLRTAAADDVFFVDRVRAHNDLGRHLALAGSPRAAGDEFRAVLDLAGSFHDTELMLASTLLDQDRIDEAMACIRHYGNLRPADARTANLLAAWLRKRPPEEAIARANALAKDHGDSSKLYVAAGKLALQLDPPDDAGARRNFERALQVNPRDAHATHLLGLDSLKQGRLAEARELFEGSCRMGFRSVELVVNLARLRRTVGENAAALEILREGATLFPDSKEIRREIESAQKPED